MKIKEARFVTKLVVSKNQDKRWVLEDHLIFESVILQDVIEVPAGFVTDFASVPRLPFVYLLAGNVGDRGATVHDYLYQTHKTSKAMADNIFLEGMKATKVPWYRRRLMYLAVKFFGQKFYDSGLKRMKILNQAGGQS